MTNFEFLETQGKYCIHCKTFVDSDSMFCKRCGELTRIAWATVSKVLMEYDLTDLPDLLGYLERRERHQLRKLMEGDRPCYSQGDTMEYQRVHTAWLKKKHLALAEALAKVRVEMNEWLVEYPEPEKRGD